jgi:hypothetical protein
VRCYLERTLLAQLDLLLPGGDGWPRYSEADTREYWFGWRARTPFTTRLGLAASVIVIGLYCWSCKWFDGPGADPGRALALAEASRLFAVRQAFVVVKSVGCLAYFSDPAVFARAVNGTEGKP